MPGPAGKSPAAARARVATPRAGKPAARRKGRPAGQALGREAVLRAVCQLLKRLSYAEVTITAVARELKVDPALIRYYFRDHDTLMAAAGMALKDEFRACTLAAVARSDGTPEGLMRARISALITIGTRYRFAMRLLSDLASHNPKPAVRKAILALTGEGMQFYDRLLRAGAARGRLRRVEPLFMAMAVLGMADVFTIQDPLFKAGRRLGLRSEAELRSRYEQFMADLLLNGLRAR
jgi:AcrR family transcriptional regulator